MLEVVPCLRVNRASSGPSGGGAQMYSRRDFGRIALASLWAGAVNELRSSTRIQSVVGGVKLGAISYSFRGLPRPEGKDYVDTIVSAFVECGIGYCELFNPMVEPITLPGGGRTPLNTPELKKMREDLRAWRLSAPLSRFKEVRKKFSDAGVDVFAYVMTFTEDFTDE